MKSLFASLFMLLSVAATAGEQVVYTDSKGRVTTVFRDDDQYKIWSTKTSSRISHCITDKRTGKGNCSYEVVANCVGTMGGGVRLPKGVFCPLWTNYEDMDRDLRNGR